MKSECLSPEQPPLSSRSRSREPHFFFWRFWCVVTFQYLQKDVGRFCLGHVEAASSPCLWRCVECGLVYEGRWWAGSRMGPATKGTGCSLLPPRERERRSVWQEMLPGWSCFCAQDVWMKGERKKWNFWKGYRGITPCNPWIREETWFHFKCRVGETRVQGRQREGHSPQGG